MEDQTLSATTIRYSDAELEEFREIVEKKLDKAKDELGYMQEQILEITENSGDDHGGDWMDDSSTNNDIEFLNNMAIRQRKYIQDLENAMIRIRNKSYGICMITGQLIDKRRLLAVPTATKSVEAKTAELAEAPKKLIEKRAPVADIVEKKEKVTSSTPKIITKVIRKSKSGAATKPVNIEDDDLDFDFEKEYAYDSGAAEEETDTDVDYEKGGAEEQPDVFDDGGGGRDDDY